MNVCKAIQCRLWLPLAFAIGAAWLEAHAATHVIDQRGLEFSEKSVGLSVGDELTFANHDDVVHNISIIDDDDDSNNLGLQKPGVMLSHTFDKNGRFRVRCGIHPGMRMTITVK